MPATQHDIEHYLSTARELAEHVAVNADRIDSDRQLPAELAAELADKGFFRLLMPRSLGGAELGHLDFLRILEVFGAVDGSTGWCINQNNVFATSCLRMPEPIAREIWSEQRAVVTNGPPTASAKAIPVDGGYRLSGRWNFSSGSTHATWIAALTPIEGSSQQPNGATDRGGPLVMLIPKQDVNFVDLWQVNGLRGTGSFSFEVDDLFIPSGHVFDQNHPPREDGPVYVIPRTLLFAAGFSTVALGIAKSSLGVAIELAGGKTPVRSRTLVQDQPNTHRLIGEGEAIWHSARAFLQESAAAVWENACADRVVGIEERIQLRLASTHAIRMAAQVVDIAYTLCGSNAIFAYNPVQRQFQDIHVITQHAQGRPAHYETAGQFYLGLEPQGNF